MKLSKYRAQQTLTAKENGGGERIARIKVELPMWKQKKIEAEEASVTRAEEEMLHMLIERVKKNKNDCNCDSCNVTTVNAPVKRGKRKQPCNNLFINSVYVNDYTWLQYKYC